MKKLSFFFTLILFSIIASAQVPYASEYPVEKNVNWRFRNGDTVTFHQLTIENKGRWLPNGQIDYIAGLGPYTWPTTITPGTKVWTIDGTSKVISFADYAGIGLGDGSFLGLDDTPDDYSGFGHTLTYVTDDEDSLIFTNHLQWQPLGLTDALLITSDDLNSGFAHISTDFSQYATFNYHNIGLTDGVHATNIFPGYSAFPQIRWYGGESYLSWQLDGVIDSEDGPVDWYFRPFLNGAGAVLADSLGDGHLRLMKVTDLFVEVDGDPANELQNLSYDDPTHTINITSGTGATIPFSLADDGTLGLATFDKDEFNDDGSGLISIDKVPINKIETGGSTGSVAYDDGSSLAYNTEFRINSSGLIDHYNGLTGGDGINGSIFIGDNGSGYWSLGTLTAPAAGISITNGAGSITFGLANDLSAIESLSSTGIAVRTGTDTWAQRTITAGSSKISISNGSGAAGNPTIDLGTVTASDLSSLGSGVATWMTTPSSANLRSALTDENGTGVALFDGATSPSFAGTTSMASATLSGKVTSYNGITTANNGAAVSVGTPVHLTGQTAAIGATTLYTADADGFYTITVQLAVTTTGGTSIGCQIRFTNVADNVQKVMPSNNQNGMNQCASTSTNNAICYTVTAYCKSGTNIQCITNLGGTGMQYSVDAFVIKN